MQCPEAVGELHATHVIGVALDTLLLTGFCGSRQGLAADGVDCSSHTVTVLSAAYLHSERVNAFVHFKLRLQTVFCS